jgi:paraquat-inducible protein B
MRGNGHAVVGAFVLGGILLALSAIVLFGKFNLFNPSTEAAVVFQDSIGGLSVGTPVTFRGVRVGAVESISIEFDPETKVAYIPVIVRLTPNRAPGARKTGTETIDLLDLITRGLRAELIVQSFVTGQAQINLDFDPSSPAILHPSITTLPEIPTRLSTLQRAREQFSQLPLRELADNATATLQSLRGLAEKLDQNLPSLVDSLKVTSDRSGQTAASANEAIKDLQARLAATLGAINQVANTGDEQLTQRSMDLHTLLTASNQTVLQVRELLTDLRSLTSERGASRTNLEAILRDLAAASASMRGFANDVEHDPRLLLTGRRP